MTTETLKALGRMTKMEAYAEAERRGAGFVANVILNWHGRPFAKLIGLVALLRAGREVRTAQFDLGTLLIDGECADWSALERAADGATA
jgi:hypothetical protein